jgi:hypothetical protein
MITFIIRCLLAASSLFFTFYLMFFSDYWGWGIVMIFPTALIILTFFINENMILALYHMRTQNTDKAKKYINKITHPHLMTKKQHANILFLQAALNQQDFGMSKSEQLIRKALSIGLKMAEYRSAAYMQLAGICIQKGHRTEAEKLLADAKKIANNAMIKDQIIMMQNQLKMAPSKNQMRMAQMMGGRKPKMR